MKSKARAKRPVRSVRARALDAGRVHRAGVREYAAVRLRPKALRANLAGQLKKLAASGVFKKTELAALLRIIELVTEPGVARASMAAVEVSAIHRALREERGVSPFALVISGIAEDSIKSVPSRGPRGGKSGGKASGATTRQLTMLIAIPAADVAGALLSLGWCIAHGKSASFTVDEMIIGAIYLSASAAGMLTE